MARLIRIVDGGTEWTGKTVRWVCLALVLAMSYEVISRYAFNAPTVWAYDTSRMLGGTIIVLGWAYVHLHGEHVRVDVIYARLNQRNKAILDLIFASMFFFPLITLLTYSAANWMIYSWSEGEKLVETQWYPPAPPIRTVVFLGFCLFALEGLAKFVRDLNMVIQGKTYD